MRWWWPLLLGNSSTAREANCDGMVGVPRKTYHLKSQHKLWRYWCLVITALSSLPSLLHAVHCIRAFFFIQFECDATFAFACLLSGCLGVGFGAGRLSLAAAPESLFLPAHNGLPTHTPPCPLNCKAIFSVKYTCSGVVTLSLSCCQQLLHFRNAIHTQLLLKNSCCQKCMLVGVSRLCAFICALHPCDNGKKNLTFPACLCCALCCAHGTQANGSSRCVFGHHKHTPLLF